MVAGLIGYYFSGLARFCRVDVYQRIFRTDYFVSLSNIDRHCLQVLFINKNYVWKVFLQLHEWWYGYCDATRAKYGCPWKYFWIRSWFGSLKFCGMSYLLLTPRLIQEFGSWNYTGLALVLCLYGHINSLLWLPRNR